MRCECVKTSEENEIIQGDTYYREIKYENEQGEEIGYDVVSAIFLQLCSMDGTIEEEHIAVGRIINVDTTLWELGEHQIRYRIEYLNNTRKTIKFKTIKVVK